MNPESVSLLKELIRDEEYDDLFDSVYNTDDEGDGVKLFYEAIFGDCEGPYVERMKEKDVAIFAVCKDREDIALVALEWYITTMHPERLPEVPAILTFMFDDDLVYGEDILEWGNNQETSIRMGVSAQDAQVVRDIAEPVLEWIRNMPDSESDS